MTVVLTYQSLGVKDYGTDGKTDQVGNKVDNTGENGKNIKKPYLIFDMSNMYYYPKQGIKTHFHQNLVQNDAVQGVSQSHVFSGSNYCIKMQK